MNAQQLLNFLDRLQSGVNPATGHPFDLPTSCLSLPDVEAGLLRLHGVVTAATRQAADAIPDSVLLEAHGELTQMGYAPTPDQLVRVLRASRTIADPTLKAVSAYGRYRQRFGKRFIESAVANFAVRHPGLFTVKGESAAPARRKKEKPPHTALPFFRENHFDKLDDGKASELKGEVDRLGFSRPTDKLPAFKQRARQNYPRAYEPWSRAEQALLIEAMCYTNDAERIATIFGRTAKSVTDAGLKLIYESKREVA